MGYSTGDSDSTVYETLMSYEKLDVYRASISFLEIAFEFVEILPRGQSALADQLKRASMSIPLNIAEGAGKTTPADQSRFYSIAKGSAMECGAILDVIGMIKFGERSEHGGLPVQFEDRRKEGKRSLARMVGMLHRMIK